MRRSDGLTQKKLLRAIFEYARDHCQNGDTAETWSEFVSNVLDLKSHIQVPVKIYRGLEIELTPEEQERITDQMDFSYNAHEDTHCPADLAQALVSKVNFGSLGTSWTWDRSCATVGGTLSYGDRYSHIILEATAYSQHVDLLVTYWQNLTTYQEEKEVRLFPNVPIKVTEMTPWNCGIVFPVRGNTGSEAETDPRHKVVEELVRLGYLR